MSVQHLQRALESVPFFSTLGLVVEEAKPGSVVLRLPCAPGNTNHAGALHSSTMFAVGEAAASVALGTHPRLAGVTHLQKATGIKYLRPCGADITAHAEVNTEVVQAILDALDADGSAQADILVRLMDGHGNDVAEVVGVFKFRAS